MNSAESVKYFHEPFNCANVPGAAEFCMRYIYAKGDLQFERMCRAAFAGHVQERSVTWMLNPQYQRFPWWPGRIIIKDVCSCFSVDWIYQHLWPVVVIVIRHPCAVASSWHRLNYDVDRHLAAVLRQKVLFEDFLQPFEHMIRMAKSFWQKMGVLWGATYYVLLQQRKNHPEWIVTEHEALCVEPFKNFGDLFNTLDLHWTRWTDEELRRTVSRHSDEPYEVVRISAQQPEKWKRELDADAIAEIRQSVEPFGIPQYSDWS